MAQVLLPQLIGLDESRDKVTWTNARQSDTTYHNPVYICNKQLTYLASNLKSKQLNVPNTYQAMVQVVTPPSLTDAQLSL